VIRDKRRSETALDTSPSLLGSDGIWKMARLLGALRACGRPIEGSRQGCGGQRGIRTLDRLSPIHAFQACAFNHSATCPDPPQAGRGAR
jgi:hypothetical protein